MLLVLFAHILYVYISEYITFPPWGSQHTQAHIQRRTDILPLFSVPFRSAVFCWGKQVFHGEEEAMFAMTGCGLTFFSEIAPALVAVIFLEVSFTS